MRWAEKGSPRAEKSQIRCRWENFWRGESQLGAAGKVSHVPMVNLWGKKEREPLAYCVGKGKGEEEKGGGGLD